MARRVFFSFHFDRDSWRAGRVRNSWVTKPNRETAGFFDSAAWESVKKKDEESIKRWIRGQMDGTTVTVVLIGNQTANRKFVRYEIQHSWDNDKGLIGVYIHNVKNMQGQTDIQGSNPFPIMKLKGVRTYDWVNDDGRNNLGAWVEAAATRAITRKK